MQCFNEVGTVLWWGPSAVRQVAKMKQAKRKINMQCSGQKGLRNHIQSLLSSSPITRLPFLWGGYCGIKVARDSHCACDVFRTACLNCCATDTKAVMGQNEKQQSDLPLGLSVSATTHIPWGVQWENRISPLCSQQCKERLTRNSQVSESTQCSVLHCYISILHMSV